MKSTARSCRPGFTLLEVLMVIAIVVILSAVMLPWGESTSHEMVESAARAVASDLAYARSLAVTNNSKYKVAFDLNGNRYTMRHSGANAALNVLPDSVFRDSNDPPDQHIVRLSELPGIARPVALSGTFHVGNSLEPMTEIEFGPLGETTGTGYSVAVLSVGSGLQRRSAVVLVNPVTGLATVHPGGRNLPSDIPAAAAQAIQNSL